jgi:hypothetical protein
MVIGVHIREKFHEVTVLRYAYLPTLTWFRWVSEATRILLN